MTEKTSKTRMQQKHDIEANWIKAGNSKNPFIPLAGEIIVYDADEKYSYQRFKIGDGITAVTNLPFAGAPEKSSSTVIQIITWEADD